MRWLFRWMRRRGDPVAKRQRARFARADAERRDKLAHMKDLRARLLEMTIQEQLEARGDGE